MRNLLIFLMVLIPFFTLSQDSLTNLYVKFFELETKYSDFNAVVIENTKAVQKITDGQTFTKKLLKIKFFHI